MKGNNTNTNKINQAWVECNNVEEARTEFLSKFPWPPRSYTCSFCKREFRSAQALGGHMNVHRRDRARLRQSPPPRYHHHVQYNSTLLNLNLEPNPNFICNPNPNSSSPSPSPSSSSLTKFTSFTSALPSMLSSPLNQTTSSASASASDQWKRWDKTRVLNEIATKALFGVEDLGSLNCEKGCRIMKNAEIITLDTEIGLVNDTNKDLDLELRLGYT